jgi:hypothetical protein
MPSTLDKVYVNTYEGYVRHLAQQRASRLLPFAMVKSVQSEAHNWERIGSAAAAQKTARKVATPDNETVFSRRVSVPKTFHVGDVTEVEDIVQMIIDPNNAYAQAHGMAMSRAHDDAIITAVTGTALDGDGATNALPAGQTIGDGTGGLTMDIVTETAEKFLASDIDPSEEKVFVISPQKMKQLLNLTEATSADYNAVRPLQTEGYVKNWMGFSWVVSTRLNAPGAGEIDCFAMTKKAIGFQMNKDVWARIEQDPSISFAWRIYCASTFGAVRVEDEHVVRVHLAEA